MENQNSELKVIIVQNNPIYKNIKKNIEILTKMIEPYSKNDNIDIVLFTEMALTGYFFDSKEDIEPYTSYCDSGDTFNFCSYVSQKLDCYTFLGFPEKEKNGNFYNSLMVTNRKGKLIKTYHKKNLFKDDKKWCTPGEKFEYIEIKTKKGKKAILALAICLDLYYQSSEKFNYEYANYFLGKNINFIIFPTNWADRNGKDNSQNAIFKAILNNWVEPLYPLFEEGNKRNIYLLAADRTGNERNVDLLGSSCIIKIKNELEMIRFLDKKENNVIVQSLLF